MTHITRITIRFLASSTRSRTVTTCFCVLIVESNPFLSLFSQTPNTSFTLFSQTLRSHSLDECQAGKLGPDFSKYVGIEERRADEKDGGGGERIDAWKIKDGRGINGIGGNGFSPGDAGRFRTFLRRPFPGRW